MENRYFFHSVRHTHKRTYTHALYLMSKICKSIYAPHGVRYVLSECVHLTQMTIMRRMKNTNRQNGIV